MDLKKAISESRFNDRKAQKFIYEQFSDQLFRISLRYCKDHAEAQDVLHDSFIKIFKSFGQFKGSRVN